MKFLRYQNIDVSHYFWRTTQQQDVDMIEETTDKLAAYEFKRGKTERGRFPETFMENIPNVETRIISPENIEEFIS